MSQEELAEKIYVTRQTISNWEIINEQDIKEFNHYGRIFTVHLVVLIVSATPLFMWLEKYAYIPVGIFMMYQIIRR